MFAVGVVTRASANFFVVSTIVGNGSRDDLLILHEPCGVEFKWRVLNFPLGGEGILALRIKGLVKDEEFPKERLFWVTENLFSSTLSARPWLMALRPVFLCQFNET